MSGEIKEVNVNGKKYPVLKDAEINFSSPNFFCSACHEYFDYNKVKFVSMDVENSKDKKFNLKIYLCKKCFKDIFYE